MKPLNIITVATSRHMDAIPWKSKAGELSFIISILSTFTKVAPL